MIREALSKTQDYYRIKGTHLAEGSGISQQHWSEYRNGKADLVTAKASAALEAMERIHPGAIRYFCYLLMSQSIGSDLKTLIEVADEDKLEEAFELIGKRMFRKNTVESDLSKRVKSVAALKSK
jgi:transcriptional regulator with XRE-family HTH domain